MDFEKTRSEYKEELNANCLLDKSVDHRWYKYVGNPITIKYKERSMEFKAGMSFGLKPAAFGYSMETDIMHEGPIQINHADGYALTKLSREMSKREARFTPAIQ